MVNKKGIIRIIEASIAVLIILSVILAFSVARNNQSEKDLSENINPLLEEIAKNNSLRDNIISNPRLAEEEIMTLLGERIREPNIGYNVSICEAESVCGLGSYPAEITGNVYAGSRMISSSLLAGAKPKRTTLFLWYKQ